jgi:hypothetical protein
MNLRPQQFRDRTRMLVGFSGGTMAQDAQKNCLHVCFEVAASTSGTEAHCTSQAGVSTFLLLPHSSPPAR